MNASEWIVEDAHRLFKAHEVLREIRGCFVFIPVKTNRLHRGANLSRPIESGRKLKVQIQPGRLSNQSFSALSTLDLTPSGPLPATPTLRATDNLTFIR